MATKKAVLHRMVMPSHTCPFGLKAKDLLRREGYEVEDHWLRTRGETDAFKAEHGVKTTPHVPLHVHPCSLISIVRWILLRRPSGVAT